MKDYIIVPKKEFQALVKAENKEEALIAFATTMDTDMTQYFDAVCVDDAPEYNKHEKVFIENLEEARRYCKGELEIALNGNDYMAMDYREELGGAFGLDAAKYMIPILTEREAEKYNINVQRCCDAVGAYTVF